MNLDGFVSSSAAHLDGHPHVCVDIGKGPRSARQNFCHEVDEPTGAPRFSLVMATSSRCLSTSWLPSRPGATTSDQSPREVLWLVAPMSDDRDLEAIACLGSCPSRPRNLRVHCPITTVRMTFGSRAARPLYPLVPRGTFEFDAKNLNLNSNLPTRCILATAVSSAESWSRCAYCSEYP